MSTQARRNIFIFLKFLSLLSSDDGSVKICPEQHIKQEEFLTQIRMQVMSILLSLIEKEAASPEALQDVGKAQT